VKLDGRRQRLDRILLVAVSPVCFLMPLWQYKSGAFTARVALAAGLVSAPVIYSVLLLSIRVRNRRNGIRTPLALLIAAVVLSVACDSALWLALRKDVSRNELVAQALSARPLSEIHPAQRALVVDLLRKTLQNSQNYEQVGSQIKPLQPPLYSAESFQGSGAIQSELSQLEGAMTLKSCKTSGAKCCKWIPPTWSRSTPPCALLKKTLRANWLLV
jgi:hypothetical protein